MNPNHYLAVAIHYLLDAPARLAEAAAVGKTLVSSSLIDRVVAVAGPRRWPKCRSASSGSPPGCSTGRICFGGEESAGASFLRMRRHASGPPTRTASSWACWPRRSRRARAATPASITANSPRRFGTPCYTRIDAPATPDGEGCPRSSTPEAVTAKELAGEPILAKLTTAPGNGAPIGGLKVVTAERLVRGPALRHREHLQDLRGEFQGRRPSPGDRRAGADDRRQHPGILRVSDRPSLPRGGTTPSILRRRASEKDPLRREPMAAVDQSAAAACWRFPRLR